MTSRSWREWWRSEGGPGELLTLALPLILSSSIWTVQTTIDRILLSYLGTEAVSGAVFAVMIFWTPFILFFNTASYASTFVAQYFGAGRPQRIGPVVWQALYFSVLAGQGFLILTLFAEPIARLLDSDVIVQGLIETYFCCLCFSALPTLIVAAVSGFFSGRGDSWTVLLINAAGLLVNAVLDYLWIFGHGGFTAWGIAGAGWATVVGMWCSAMLALGLMLRTRYREEYGTLSGWRFEGALFRRLMHFGLPSGLQWLIDGLAFTTFFLVVGKLGPVERDASSLAFSMNAVAFLPMFGLAQGVSILVGQRLGHDRPDLAERSTWNGSFLAWLYMTAVALLYVLAPGLFLRFFDGGKDQEQWSQVALVVPVLLRFVAVYSLVDSLNLTLSFALRGAGDTRFVTLVSLTLSWPIMVLPTALAWYHGWGLYWAWTFASAYIVLQAIVFLIRFRQGKWKSMRVIEPAVFPEDEPVAPEEPEMASLAR
jgi:MATE family multidrug resistance protein